MDTFCKGCGHKLKAPLEQYDAYEGMHWFCFHYAFEHFPDDPESPCESRHCPTWHLSILKEALRSKGEDPEKIINEAIENEWSKSNKK